MVDDDTSEVSDTGEMDVVSDRNDDSVKRGILQCSSAIISFFQICVL